jgi:hypothetical protein
MSSQACHLQNEPPYRRQEKCSITDVACYRYRFLLCKETGDSDPDADSDADSELLDDRAIFGAAIYAPSAHLVMYEHGLMLCDLSCFHCHL